MKSDFFCLETHLSKCSFINITQNILLSVISSDSGPRVKMTEVFLSAPFSKGYYIPKASNYLPD